MADLEDPSEVLTDGIEKPLKAIEKKKSQSFNIFRENYILTPQTTSLL
jgi:hypothetical protein